MLPRQARYCAVWGQLCGSPRCGRPARGQETRWIRRRSICWMNREQGVDHELRLLARILLCTALGALTRTATPIPTYLHLGTIILGDRQVRGEKSNTIEIEWMNESSQPIKGTSSLMRGETLAGFRSPAEAPRSCARVCRLDTKPWSRISRRKCELRQSTDED